MSFYLDLNWGKLCLTFATQESQESLRIVLSPQMTNLFIYINVKPEMSLIAQKDLVQLLVDFQSIHRTHDNIDGPLALILVPVRSYMDVGCQ